VKPYGERDCRAPTRPPVSAHGLETRQEAGNLGAIRARHRRCRVRHPAAVAACRGRDPGRGRDHEDDQGDRRRCLSGNRDQLRDRVPHRRLGDEPPRHSGAGPTAANSLPLAAQRARRAGAHREAHQPGDGLHRGRSGGQRRVHALVLPLGRQPAAGLLTSADHLWEWRRILPIAAGQETR
jgi:hypothetical protein